MSKPETKLSNTDKYFDTDYLRSDIKKQAIRGASVVLFSQIITLILQILSIIILARLLTPADFGLVAMITTFSLLLTNFGFNGFTEAIIQKEEINHQMISSLFWINMIISLALTVLFISASPLFAWFYKEQSLKAITIGIALSILATGLSTIHLAILQRNMQFFESSLITVAAKIISTVLAVVLAWQGTGYWALVAGTVVLPLSSALGAWLLCGWRPGRFSLYTGIAPMIKFALHTFGNFTLRYCSRNTDNLLIGWCYGSQSLGFYKKAYDLFALPVGQLTSPLTGVALATLSRFSNDPEKYLRYYLDIISRIAFIGMPLSAILTLTGNDLILLILGPQWNKAGEIFTYFGIGIGVMLIYSTHGWLHLSLGRADRWLRWGLIELITTVLFFMIGLPFGTTGIAVAWTASFYALIVPGIWYAGEPINLKWSSLVSTTWRYFFSALTSGIFCWFILYSFGIISRNFIELNILFRIFISTAFCISMYLLLVVALYQSTKPISQFVFLLYDMLPNILAKKSKISTI
jgi:PST family polysaccharide transporter